eukprot:9339675-Lingulodinium_polyedra.AAC.1
MPLAGPGRRLPVPGAAAPAGRRGPGLAFVALRAARRARVSNGPAPFTPGALPNPAPPVRSPRP